MANKDEININTSLVLNGVEVKPADSDGDFELTITTDRCCVYISLEDAKLLIAFLQAQIKV